MIHTGDVYLQSCPGLIFMSEWMSEWLGGGEAVLSDFITVSKITSWPHNWKEAWFHSGPHDHDYISKVQSVCWLLCRSTRMMVFYIIPLFGLVGFWLNNAVEGAADIAAVLGGYLSRFVVWKIDFLPPTTLMKPLLGVPLGIHLVLITLGYLIWSLFKQEWMLGFASGVCLRMGPFLLVFVFKVKAWLMWLTSCNAVFVQLQSKLLDSCPKKKHKQAVTCSYRFICIINWTISVSGFLSSLIQIKDKFCPFRN